MSKKKILFLGGAYAQIPILQEAKDRGHYIVTCDYTPDNPGHMLADEYYNISTTDMAGVLELAEKLKPDFVIAYASDPAAPVASYVSEKMGLPGNSYKSVQILSEKDLFRKYLKNNGFNAPEMVTIRVNENPVEKLSSLQFPFIIKPTDSSGSKGVSKIIKKENILPAVKSAFDFSRNKRIIAEAFIDNQIADIHGDGFVIDGELVFSYLGDHIYNRKSNPYNPIGTLWPSRQPFNIIKKVEQDTASIIKGTGFKNGPVNIEARIDSADKIYIMEIGPRNGGHFVPQAIKYATGFDMVKASLDILEDKKILIPDQMRKHSAYYAIHSDFNGELVHLSLSDELKPFVHEFHQYISPGKMVKSFEGANAAIGILLMTFSSREEMDVIMNKIGSMINMRIHFSSEKSC